MIPAPRSTARRPLVAVTAGLAVAALSIGQPALAAPATAAAPDDVSSHVILDYDFDGATSPEATVVDTSGDGRNGVLTNPGSAQLVDGPSGSGKALHLSGGARTSTTAPFITLPKGVFQGLQSTTISSWVKWDGGDAFQWLYTLGKDRDNATFYTPRFDGDNNARSSLKPTSQGEVGARSGSPLPANEWHLVTTTIDDGALVYYLDGLEVSRTTVGADVASVLFGESSPNSGYIGQPFWTGAHPFFAGALDDFRIYDTALTADQVRELAGTAAPTVTELRETAVEVRTDVGVAPTLPGVKAAFSDGQERLAPVTWDAVTPAQYAQRGVFTVEGTVDGIDATVTATVRVIEPGELSIDVGDTTGAFMGGASGTLYGLYGPGLPSNNLIDGIQLRTVSTKAQDGPQHPGADALEVVKPLADSSNGDVYIYMTDINRGFPYQVPGNNGAEKEAWYLDSIGKQVDQVLTLPKQYQDRIVFVPFNEPEGNMYGGGGENFWGYSWLDNPDRFFSAWDRAYRIIKDKMPDARIGGPNTSILFDQNYGFLQHAIANDTVPQAFTWHELSNPATIRDSVAKYRGWEDELFAGTKWEGTHLPINVNEYAFNYHTSVPAQMIQWISAIEDSKIDADIAYWNIDGNLSDSAVQSNRGNGQWWLLNAYGNMTGETVAVHPPRPGESYTLQGVATLDEENKKVHALIGGSFGDQSVYVDRLPDYLSGSVHVQVRDIRWTGQIGDSGEPQTVAEYDAPVSNGSLGLQFGQGALPELGTDSAYEIIVTPGTDTTSPAQSPVSWRGVYEAENARFDGATPEINGPEGTPSNVSGFYTSGTKNVGGIRGGSDLKMTFDVDVPEAGAYDLSVLASAFNKESLNEAQGPVNMFVTVNGGAEQEIFAELGYKWVVWNHTDTTVDLRAGENTITIAAKSLDGTKQTVGTAIIDKIDVTRANPGYLPIYEAENGVLSGTSAAYDRPGVSGSGYVPVGAGQSVTFWVYSPDDAEKSLEVKTLGGGTGTLRVNNADLGSVSDTVSVPAFLRGGINKVEVVGGSGTLAVDRVAVQASENALASQTIEAESGTIAGDAKAQALSLASAGEAVVGVGGAPGNGNTLTNTVTVDEAGTYAMTIRYSNEEQSPASHYNPDPVARRADISVNGGPVQKVLFPQSYNANQFWELTVEVELTAGENTIRFASEEQPDFNADTFISERFPTLGLRSQWAPNLDRLTFTALLPAEDPVGQAQIDTSADSVVQGGTVTVTGTGFAANEKIALELHSDVLVLGEATTDAAGAFSQTVTVPATAPVGDHEVVATGADSARTASTSLAVSAASGSGGDGGSSGGGGSTGGGSTGGGAGSGAGGTGSSGGSGAGGTASGTGAVGSAAGSSSSTGALASTGGAFAGLGVLLAGAAAIAAGAALLARRRERIDG
ncbi:LamG-like jellyroll fold domain-containing protein [Microbacterium sp. PRF11]|uniref:LamG-like jellyroll fold domain-containing protein n=1 Tax=Microbacterium sp. PRF11 TaxID=2962593 RepID=UPI002881B49A|nr:LamG-like jellyroll fold domain-containing protein [Microbacterium sp. PRF11]MDT0117070.1 LamG-like jellyroll fold domain-containing protein [Microbacterium sp. PRF11]